MNVLEYSESNRTEILARALYKNIKFFLKLLFSFNLIALMILFSFNLMALMTFMKPSRWNTKLGHQMNLWITLEYKIVSIELELNSALLRLLS